jgi:hypothetical protein
VSVSQGFSFARRRSPVRVLRLVLRLLIGSAIVAVLWGALVGVLWLVGSNQMRGVPLAALRDDVLMLGASGARSPEDATTVLLLLVEPLDPTVLRPSPLVAPPAILQLGGPRELPAALVLPDSVEVLVDGRGSCASTTSSASSARTGSRRRSSTTRRSGSTTWSSVSTEALPTLVRLLGPLEVCGGWGCDEPTPDEVRAWQRDPDPEVVLEPERRRAPSRRRCGRHGAVRPHALLGREVVGVLAGQVVTDVDLSIRRLLELAPGARGPDRIDIDRLPMRAQPGDRRARRARGVGDDPLPAAAARVCRSRRSIRARTSRGCAP